MEYEKFSQFIRVSRETHLRLSRYVELLEEWGVAINLVSGKEELWQRHIIDSAQLAKQIPEDSQNTIIDLGSGGGLPGIVLAIILPNKITMVESDRRKALFLKHCIHELELENAKVENLRIEHFSGKANIVTARALASLKQLIEYAKPFLLKDTTCLFPKGRNYDKECKEAERFWEYEKEIISSLSGDGALLILKTIKRKDGNQ